MKIIYLTIFFFWINLINPLFAQKNIYVVVKIENQIITNYEIKNKILSSLIVAKQEINQININNFKKRSLEILIQNKLKKLELSKYNFDVDQSQINSYLQKISSNNLENFKFNFKNNDIDFELFLEDIEVELTWQKFIFEKYANKITIDDEVVNNEVRSLLSKKSIVEEYNISEIEILIDDKNTVSEKVKLIKKSINEQGFDLTALKYSNSPTSTKNGLLGWIKGPSLSKNIYDIITRMKIDDVSEPIKQQNSIVFFKLNNKRFANFNNLSEEELKKDLVKKKRNELFNLYSRNHLSLLRNNTLIEYK